LAQRVTFKIRKYGIQGKVHSWIKDYLSNSRQSTKIANNISSEKYINSGVLQGSVLGPLLFLIYINDIYNLLNSLCCLYADDTSLIVSLPNLYEIEYVCNHDLDILNQWSNKWLKSLYLNKSEIMVVSNINMNLLSF